MGRCGLIPKYVCALARFSQDTLVASTQYLVKVNAVATQAIVDERCGKPISLRLTSPIALETSALCDSALPVIGKPPRLRLVVAHDNDNISLPAPASIDGYAAYDCTTIATDGSADLDSASGWGFTIWRPDLRVVLDFCGPTELDCAARFFLGARRHTNNVGEVAALLLALRWVKANTVRRATILYDSEDPLE